MRKYLNKHPVVLLNIAFIFLIGSMFLYQAIRPLDVLENWRLELAPVRDYRLLDGRRLPIYHPNESLIFTSTSMKVSYASGDITRTLVCEPTQELDEREILLDVTPANKEVGPSPERASSIILPDVVQFNRLPRVCRLVIDITYTNVALWRNHTEHAETEPFLVEELQLTPRQMREEIEKLNQQIGDLERRLMGDSSPVQSWTNTQSNPQTITIPENEIYIPDTPAPQTTPQEKGLIERITDPLLNLLNL